MSRTIQSTWHEKAWTRRRMNYTERSYGIRRSFRRANRIRTMPVAHWQAYLDGSRITGQQLIHKGGKP